MKEIPEYIGFAIYATTSFGLWMGTSKFSPIIVSDVVQKLSETTALDKLISPIQIVFLTALIRLTYFLKTDEDFRTKYLRIDKANEIETVAISILVGVTGIILAAPLIMVSKLFPGLVNPSNVTDMMFLLTVFYLLIIGLSKKSKRVLEPRRNRNTFSPWTSYCA